MATFEEFGSVGKYYFSREVDWLRRHVQHISFPDPESEWLQLTIDLALPSEEARVDDRSTASNEFEFCLPVARLRKGWPLHELDFVDESRRGLPLFTRDASATISAVALTGALLGAGIDSEALTIELDVGGPNGIVKHEEQDIIDRLVRMDPIPATSYRALARGLLSRLESPQRERLLHLVTDLSKSSYIWLPLRGEPGQQRTIKLSYGVELPTNASIQRKPGVRSILPFESHALPVSVVIPGPIDIRKTGAKFAQEGLAAFGLATRDFLVPTINEHVESYHLAFTAPPGVVVDGVDADLTTEHGARFKPPVACRSRQATLYFSGEPWAGGRAVLSLRPDLGGLGLAGIYSVATALLLWAVDNSRPVSSDAKSAVAAVLVVVPTFLVVFARRRSEHVLVGSLLRGIRLLVLIVAALAITAGAAVAGLHMWLSTEHTLDVCADAATGAAVLLVIAWLRWAATSGLRWGQRARLREPRPG